MITRAAIRLPGLTLLLLALLPCAATVAEVQNPQYQRLQAALLRYEQIAAEGGWPTVPAGPTIEPGSHDPRVTALARRLVVSGDLDVAESEPAEYGAELRTAVLRFQHRHGLLQDALVGKNTLRALNVSVEQRIRQMQINLERLTRVYVEPRGDFLLVNVPAFEVTLFRDNEARWTGKVVVGETDTETPLFEAPMTYVVVNPSWTVPHSISSEELLPKIQRDPGFLARGGYELFDPDGNPVDPASVDWSTLHVNNFPYTLVQRPGTLNQLGRIKFMFPNPFDVCMHDTPTKHLFERDSRAFSHGCIRVSQPVEFAAHLLEPEGLTKEQIVQQLETTETHTVLLGEPLPVVVTYITAEADEDGVVYFYRDVYSRDGR